MHRWCTIEEARIWDIGLTETERLAHFYSPALAAVLSRLRLRLSQAFATVLSMSQRMQFELQRWHAAWLEQGEKLKREEAQRQALQHRVSQLQERVSSLEEELTLYSAKAGGDPHPFEKAFHRLQEEGIRRSQELRAAHAKNTSMRTETLTLRLSNEGLLEELSRWRASVGDDPNSPLPAVPPPARSDSKSNDAASLAVEAPSDTSGSASETQPLLELFASYPPEAQRVALDAILRVHEALTGEAATLTTGLPDVSGEAAAAEPSADATSTVPPRGVDPSKRLLALEQLADTLSEEESQVLIRSVARRRAALSASAEL